MKKLLTLTLSLLMALSLCLTISAEDNYYEIGDNKYSDLQAALYAVNSSTSSDEITIKLLAERTETGSGNGSSFSIDSGKNIVLDLNGNTLTLNNYSISCYGNLTITGNGQIEFTGWNNSSYACINVANGATFTLKSGIIKYESNSGYDSTIFVYTYTNASHVLIEGGSIESSGGVACIRANKSGATAEVNGGTFKGSNIFVEENGGEIIVYSGTYSNDVSGYLADGYRIIYQENLDSPFKVVKNDEKVTVESTTGAMSSEARTALNGKTIHGENSFSTTVNKSTQIN